MNKFLKRAFLALSAAALTTAPAFARVEAGTNALLRLLEQRGSNVVINPSDCRTAQYAGYYEDQTLAVCIDTQQADADDHDTVRHEAIHAIQHCVAEKNGRQGLIPIIRDSDDYANFVTSVLTPQGIERIKETYPQHAWLVEFEAFAAAHVLSAEDIAQLFVKHCSGIRS